jgi:SagB-type dehydrogenase family enzyme
MIRFEDPTTLSLLFHLNSEPWLNDEAYKGGTSNQEFKRPEGILAETALPEVQNSLTELFRKRRSCRAFSCETMPLAQVAALLAAAYGIVEIADFGDQSKFLRRSVPSAGGLFPLEVYAFAQRVEGLEDGLYHYDVLSHAVQLMASGDFFPSLEPVFYTYPFFRNANLVICLAAVFPRTQKKYGPRGYRYILLEAGHSGQNICLQAAEMNLSTLCMGGFVDSRLNLMLSLSLKQEGVVYSVAVGYPLQPHSRIER